MKEKETLYDSPKVKVVEIKMRKSILAASDPNIMETYDRENW